MIPDTEGLTKVHIDLPNHWWFKGESLWAKGQSNFNGRMDRASEPERRLRQHPCQC